MDNATLQAELDAKLRAGFRVVESLCNEALGLPPMTEAELDRLIEIADTGQS
jgi:hypothetical protein